MRLTILSIALAATAATVGHAGTASVAADTVVRLIDANGKPVGTAALTAENGGVRVRVSARGLAPGEHGIHFHERGVCKPPDFASAGGHFNPFGAKHGLLNPKGPHAGDLPNLVVGPDGRAEAIFFTPRVTLERGKPNSLLRSGGTSLVIHEKRDDQRTDPTGNSGARVACGEIR